MKRNTLPAISPLTRAALLAAGARAAALAVVRIAPNGVPRKAQQEINAYQLSRWLEGRGAMR